MAFLIALFPKEVLLALTSILVAAGIDAGLSAVLAIQGKRPEPFQWKRLPQFLVTNALWPALGLIVGGALLKYYPELREPYFLVTAGVDAWLAKDWRSKFNLLIGIKLPAPAPTTGTATGAQTSTIPGGETVTEPSGPQS